MIGDAPVELFDSLVEAYNRCPPFGLRAEGIFVSWTRISAALPYPDQFFAGAVEVSLDFTPTFNPRESESAVS